MASDPYLLGRGMLSSVRLYLQHYMWRSQLGYHLHPDIPQEGEGLKIADVACGTGIWLVELAKSLSGASAEFDGFDISSAQFPSKAWLPERVNLQTLDITAPIPENLVERYDIVHLSLVVTVVRNNDPGPLLDNLLKLLKPGGYLQWDEVDIENLHARHAVPGTPIPHTEDWHKKWSRWSSMLNMHFGWVGKLDKTFAEYGLESVQYIRKPIQNDIARPWAFAQLMGSAEVIEAAVMPMCLKNPDMSPNAEEWRESFKNMMEERQSGDVVTESDMIVVVGKKAE